MGATSTVVVSTDALRLVWGGLVWLGLLGLAWHLWLWGRALYWSREARRRQWDGPDRAAQDTRRLEATYRVVVKLAFTGYAVFRWDILVSVAPAVLDWRQAGDAALFALGMGLLTAWSLHTYWAMQHVRTAQP